MVRENDDREYILEGVKEEGELLKMASSRLQTDLEIVYEAVMQDHDSLEYAAESVKD